MGVSVGFFQGVEIALLSFVAGIAVCMAVSSAVHQFRMTFVVLAGAICVIAFWAWYGFYGSEIIVERLTRPINESKSSQFQAPVQSSVKASTEGAAHEQSPSDETSQIEAQAVATKLTQMGQAGDLFGGLNSLFAGLAFAGVAFAAFFQHKAMKAQHEQLELAKDQLADDRKMNRRAAFEPLFFQLIELFQRLDQQLVLSHPHDAGKKITKGEFLKFLRDLIELQWSSIYGAKHSNETMRDLLAAIHATVYNANEDQLGPLFRTLYHMFRLIHNSGLEESDQARYANIARGLLGRDFLLLLMINSFTHYGRGFAPYIEIYGLLKHVALAASPGGIDRKIAEFGFSPCAVMNYQERLKYWENNIRPVAPP